MAETTHEMRIGELSERSGRTVRTLHFYEELGLLSPAGRTKGGFRLYDEHALLRIQWISRLQDLGFSLPEIKEFLGQLQGKPNAPAAMSDLRSFYADKLRETRATIARLVALEAELKGSLDYLDGCRPCSVLSGVHACRTCNEHPVEAPAMVAAVTESSPEGK
ncbi:MAG: MerR family transcriptional regulator [Myxococcota bacterium]